MIWVQPAPWSRCCAAAAPLDIRRFIILCLLGGFEQAANLLRKNSKVNRKAWNPANFEASEDISSEVEATPSLPREWTIDNDQSVNSFMMFLTFASQSFSV